MAIVLAGCSAAGAGGLQLTANASGPAAAPTRSPAAVPTTHTPSPSAVPSPPPSVAPATASAMAESDCPVTVPKPPFLAPQPWPKVPPSSYHAAWFGTSALWTMLDLGGEHWHDLPFDGRTLGQKTFWWSAKYRDARIESSPAIRVVGRRLDGSGETFTAGDPGTNASSDFGLSMLVGVNVPAPGCWSLSATYRGTSLDIVVWIEG